MKHNNNNNNNNNNNPSSPTSSTSSKTDNNNNNNNLDIDGMLKHFDLTPNTYGNQLWQRCFENISYHNVCVNVNVNRHNNNNNNNNNINNQFYNGYDYNENDMISHAQMHKKDIISVAICNKCMDGYINTDVLQSNTKSSPFACYDDHNNQLNQCKQQPQTDPDDHDIYHDSSFHFIFGIEGLGVFEYCKYCLINQSEAKNTVSTHNKPQSELHNNNHIHKNKSTDNNNMHASFNLDNYLKDMISEQLDMIHTDNKNRDEKQDRIDIKLCINELITHCKKCGMTDRFIDELKQCYKHNPIPHSLIDLKSIQQITFCSNLFHQKILLLHIQTNVRI